MVKKLRADFEQFLRLAKELCKLIAFAWYVARQNEKEDFYRFNEAYILIETGIWTVLIFLLKRWGIPKSFRFKISESCPVLKVCAFL